jgi:phosphoglycolate phosphatase
MTGRNNDFQLLVFDWDGTLIDSIGRIVACTQETLRRLALPAVPDDHIRTSIGLGIREMVDRFHPGCTDEEFARILEVYRGLWFERYSLRPSLFEGVRETLDELASRDYLLAVATAKSRTGLSRDLEGTGLAGLFHASRTADEALAKPNPAMLLEILDELGVRAGEALMIGDTVHDLQMAVNAGVPGLGVTSGSHSREELEVVEALDYLDGVVEMPEWLGRWDAEDP